MTRPLLSTIMLCVLLATFHTHALAQCKETNTAFLAGEELRYDLYFNWKFVWLNAGKAKLATNGTTWEGAPAFRSMLITSTNKKLDKFFMMRDTLHSIITNDLVPLYYKKAANEGGKYYVDQVWYGYKGGKTHLRQQYLNRRGETSHTTHESSDCIYDMLSMMLRARSFNASNFKKGDKLLFPMASGRKVEQTTLVYRGKKKLEMKSTGTTYQCLVFSFVEYQAGKEKEIITFYITDDDNHLPVRLDMFLRFGTAKAYLTETKGLRHPVFSIIKE